MAITTKGIKTEFETEAPFFESVRLKVEKDTFSNEYEVNLNADFAGICDIQTLISLQAEFESFSRLLGEEIQGEIIKLSKKVK